MSKFRIIAASVMMAVFAFMAIWGEQLQIGLTYAMLTFLAVEGAILFLVVGVSANQYGETTVGKAPAVYVGGTMLLTGLVGLILGAIFSWEAVPTAAYRDQIGQQQEINAKDKNGLPTLDINRAPLVSQDMALRAAEKQLSSAENTSLGSMVEIGKLEKQRVGNGLYWVAFLEHRGFFKWNAKGETPGYVMVNAHNPNDVKLVTHLKDKQLHMKYLPSAYFSSNVQRHVYFSGYMTKGLTDWSPEIDDEGNPFIVATLFERKIGLSGFEATGVVVVDVQTGAIKEYSIENAPAWIDRIQPEYFVHEQVQNNLELAGGWFNPSNTNKLTTTKTSDLLFLDDNQPYFYIGHQSTGGDNAIVGFSLVNSRTKKAYSVRMSGISEATAQAAAEKMYPEKHYSATNALPFMVEGIPTYVMALRDDQGVSRMYAMVAVESVQKMAVADTLAATARQYLSKVAQDNSSAVVGASATTKVVEGEIARIGSIVKGGDTSYILQIKGYKPLLAAGNAVSDEIALSEKGDKVKVTVQEGKSFATVIEFENSSLH